MQDRRTDAERTPAVEAVDAAYITRLLHRNGYGGVEVTDVVREPVAGKSHGGGSLHRFRFAVRSTTGEAASAAPTSLILKESRDIGSQALDPDYARREVECYEHDLFAGLGKRLHVPTAYEAAPGPEAGHYWIWMEDLGGAFDVEWTMELLASAVRDITELNAVWWGRERELSEMPFLRRRAQAMYDGLWVERIATNCAAVETHPRAEEISPVFTPERRRLLMRLSRAADVVYPRLESLPQTLLHHDVWLPNLGRLDGRTVLIDWSYVGPGTPGVELSQTMALMFQVWGGALDDRPFLEALYRGLVEDWGIEISYEEVVSGYELAFCLRPAHALGAPILGGILSGRTLMVGSDSLDDRLAAADATLRRIERGARRLEW